MKKWIVFICVAAVAICGFAVVSKLVTKETGITTYKQYLIYNDNDKKLEGKETINFYNYTDVVLNEICLHLYPNAYKEGSKSKVVSLSVYEKAYPNGVSYGDIKIESVSHGNDYLEYEITGQDENILKIKIDELYPNDYFEFEVGFSVNIANINHRLGYGASTINLCNYYPIVCVYEDGAYKTDLYDSNGDPFYSKVANYEVCITYPKNLILASTGSQKNVIDGENKKTTITASSVRDFAMVLSPRFEVRDEIYDGVRIQYYFYDDTDPKTTLKVIKDTLTVNKKYGKYPYGDLSVVESNFVHGGMEYPGLVLISDDLEDYDTYLNVVVHELCHQWWYGVVGNDEYNYGFLDEGLTDYCTARFYDYYPELGHSSKEIFHNAAMSYTNFVKIYSDVKGDDFKTDMLRSLNDFETENEYVYLCYVKSMLMFATLEDLLGTKKFDACLKYYYECNKYQEAGPYDLAKAFSSASGKDLNSFFESWFNGTVVIGDF